MIPIMVMILSDYRAIVLEYRVYFDDIHQLVTIVIIQGMWTMILFTFFRGHVDLTLANLMNIQVAMSGILSGGGPRHFYGYKPSMLTKLSLDSTEVTK